MSHFQIMFVNDQIMRINNTVIYRVWHILYLLFLLHVWFKGYQMMAFRKTLVARNAYAYIALNIGITLSWDKIGTIATHVTVVASFSNPFLEKMCAIRTELFCDGQGTAFITKGSLLLFNLGTVVTIRSAKLFYSTSSTFEEECSDGHLMEKMHCIYTIQKQ